MNPIKHIRQSALSIFRHKMRRYHACDRGSIVVEFGLSVPVFIAILLGLVELGNYLQTQLKVYHTSVTIADLITRDEVISEAGITDIFSAAGHVMAPYPLGAASKIIITNIHKPTDEKARILWQRDGAGSMTASSKFGRTGDEITTVDGITLHDNESIIIAEIYYDYTPIVAPKFQAQRIYKTTFYRPRIGALTSIDP